jgi:hypothetical protein
MFLGKMSIMRVHAEALNAALTRILCGSGFAFVDYISPGVRWKIAARIWYPLSHLICRMHLKPCIKLAWMVGCVLMAKRPTFRLPEIQRQWHPANLHRKECRALQRRH